MIRLARHRGALMSQRPDTAAPSRSFPCVLGEHSACTEPKRCQCPCHRSNHHCDRKEG